MAVILRAGFEAGNTSEWTTTTAAAGSTVAADASAALTGSYGLRVAGDETGSSQDSNYVRQQFGPPGSGIITVEFAFRPDVNPAANVQAAGSKALALISEGNNLSGRMAWIVFTSQNTSEPKFQLAYRTKSGTDTLNGSTHFPAMDTWHYYRLTIDKTGSDPVVTFSQSSDRATWTQVAQVTDSSSGTDGLSRTATRAWFGIVHISNFANTNYDYDFDDIEVRDTTDPIENETIEGYTTNGTGAESASVDRLFLTAITPSQSGELQSIAARLQVTSGSTSARGVVYSDSGGAPDTLLATGTAFNINLTTATWHYSPTSLTLTGGTTYWVGVHVQDPGTPSFAIWRQASGGSTTYADDAYAGGAASPYVQTGTFSTAIDCHIIYSASGGGASHDGSASATQGLTDAASGTITRHGSATAGQSLTAAVTALVTRTASASATQGLAATASATRTQAGVSSAVQSQTGAADGHRTQYATATATQELTSASDARRTQQATASATQTTTATAIASRTQQATATGAQGLTADASATVDGAANEYAGSSSATQGLTASASATLSTPAASTATQSVMAASAAFVTRTTSSGASQSQTAATAATATRHGLSSATQSVLAATTPQLAAWATTTGIQVVTASTVASVTGQRRARLIELTGSARSTIALTGSARSIALTGSARVIELEGSYDGD